MVAVALHAAARRPVSGPAELLVAADGSVASGDRFAALRPGTAVGRYALRIVAGSGAERLHVVLLIDQLDAEEWARVSAILRRASYGGARGPAPPQARPHDLS